MHNDKQFNNEASPSDLSDLIDKKVLSKNSTIRKKKGKNEQFEDDNDEDYNVSSNPDVSDLNKGKLDGMLGKNSVNEHSIVIPHKATAVVLDMLLHAGQEALVLPTWNQVNGLPPSDCNFDSLKSSNSSNSSSGSGGSNKKTVVAKFSKFDARLFAPLGTAVIYCLIFMILSSEDYFSVASELHKFELLLTGFLSYFYLFLGYFNG